MPEVAPAWTESAKPTSDDNALLSVRNLKVHFPVASSNLFDREKRVIRAVDDISFSVNEGQTFGLVGESGCGKSTTARAVLRLIAPTGGNVRFAGKSLKFMGERELRQMRRDMQMIFQDPFASLNPRMTVGRIIAEPMAIFNLCTRKERKMKVMALMDRVGLNPKYLNRYPHEFSGGQRQRIGIARALAVEPKLIICDEPISALDVSIQAQIVNLLMELQRELNLAYVFIAHDLSVVRHISHRIGVMYLGRLMEVADSDELYRSPRHPYTQALLSAVPIPDPEVARTRKRQELEGEIPSPDKHYVGCPFADRCPIVETACRSEPVPLLGSTHQVACIKAQAD